MRIILQDRFKLLKEGKIANDVFVKEANMLYPSLIKASLHADDAISILKRRNIIFEDVNQNTSEKSFESEFQKFLLEVKNEAPKDAKAVEKQTSKQVEDSYTRGHNFKDNTNPNNISNQQFMNGMMAEYGDPKNDGKTYDQFVDIVVKNLMKDPLFYVKNSAFGIKGIGYTDETPGLKASKTDKMEKINNPNLTANITKSNTKDISDKMPKSKVKDEMTMAPKSSKGVQKMDTPGKEKKVKLSEGYMGEKGDKVQISKSKNTFILEKPDGSAMVDMFFSDKDEAKKYADKKGLIVVDGSIKEESKYSDLYESEFDGSGLVVVGSTQTDNNAIQDMLVDSDFYGVWNSREGYFFFPEEESLLDGLEQYLQAEFDKNNISARFESQIKENIVSENEEIDEKTIDEKINDLIQHKIFMQEMNMDDYSPEEAYQFLSTEYSDEDIIDFHNKVYGGMELEESRTKLLKILDKGHNSFYDGKSLKDNPYDEYYEAQEYRHWEQGWKQAETEENDDQSASAMGVSLDETEKNTETNKNIMENQDPTQLFKKFLLTENNVNEYAEQNPDDNEEYSKIYSTLKDTYKNSGDDKNIKRRALLKFKEKFGREPMLEKCGDEVNETAGEEKIEIDRPYEYKDNKGNIKKGYNVGNGGDGNGGYLYWMRAKIGDKQSGGDNIPKENIIRKLDYITESKKIPVSKKIAEIEKNSTTVALESKINAIEEEITRRNNQIKMVDENEDLSELVDKNRMKELQKEIKILEKQKEKYVKLYEKQTGKKKQEVVTDATADAAEEAPIEEATAEDITAQKELNAELENTKKSATELSTLSKESGLAEEVQPSEDELTKMKDELDSYVDMVSNFEEAVEMYISLHPEAKQYEVTLRQLAEPMF